jgi:hypothetical protein
MPAMPSRWRAWWPWLKGLLATAIIGGVGWQFARLLSRPELWDRPWSLRPGGLVAAVALYALGLGCWGGFWVRLLARLGVRPPLGPAYRAYYVSHVGKYVPGKAWAILLRATLLPGVTPGIAALTAVYETLTTMAAGALLAACLVPWLVAGRADLGWQALGLLALAGVPLLPAVFNGLVVRLVRPFLDPAAQPPRFAWSALPEGFAWATAGWACLGASAAALFTAVLPDAPPLTAGFFVRCTAYNALSYVAGFLALPAPGGLGVRELIFQQLLTGDLRGSHSSPVADGMAALAVVVLRLVWTAADLLTAAMLYGWPGEGKTPGTKSQIPT